MDEIRDGVGKKSKKSTFTYGALICGIATLVFLVAFINLYSGTIELSEGIPQPSIFQIRGTQIFVLLGIIFTILSITKKEPWNWMKWVSTILNILLFIVIFSSICFYYVIEFTR